MYSIARLIARNLATAVTAVIAVSCGYISSAPLDTGHLYMTRVTAAQLEHAHLTLYPPNASAVVSQAAAERVAEQLYHADSILESVLAVADNPYLKSIHDNPGGPPGLHRLAWVVALPPKFAPPLHGPIKPGQSPSSAVQPTYLPIVIDAQTGRPIYDSMGVA